MSATEPVTCRMIDITGNTVMEVDVPDMNEPSTGNRYSALEKMDIALISLFSVAARAEGATARAKRYRDYAARTSFVTMKGLHGVYSVQELADHAFSGNAKISDSETPVSDMRMKHVISGAYAPFRH